MSQNSTKLTAADFQRNRNLQVAFAEEWRQLKRHSKRGQRATSRKRRKAQAKLRKQVAIAQPPRPPKPVQIGPRYPRPPKLDKRPSYLEYITSEHWKKVRLWKLELVGFKCEKCGHNGKLHVHHKHYRTLGRERAKDLESLCDQCHGRFHEGLAQAKSHMLAMTLFAAG